MSDIEDEIERIKAQRRTRVGKRRNGQKEAS